MNILLDLYLEKNLGDDLFLQSILDKYPNDNWYIVTRENYKELENKNTNLTMIRLPKIMNYILHKTQMTHLATKYITHHYHIDAFATVGGSIFIEYDGWEKLYKIREDNWHYFKKNNKPVFIIGANFGPYQTSEFLQKYTNLFNQVTDICFRDSYSANLFSESTNVRYETDVVMSFDIAPYNTIPLKKAIGISIMDLTSRPKLKHLQEKYIEKMVDLTQLLLNDGYEVYLMSFCKSEGDEKTSEKILQIIANNEKLKRLDYDGNIVGFLQVFSSFKAVIGCRFHSVILSYLFSKSVQSIIYSKKTSDFITEWEIPSDTVDIEDIEKLSYNQVTYSITNKSELNNDLILSAHRQFEAMDLWMNKNNNHKI